MATRKPKRKRAGAPKGNTNRRRAEAPSVAVSIKCTPNELSSYRALARWRGLDFSALARELLNAALLHAVTQGGWQPPRERGARGD